ncbi:hypothetical protein LTR27_010962 [Elasticomyces elasticus]|nr:hypothetical protein LTR27_010962 [Elasticomyces elasticus]
MLSPALRRAHGQLQSHRQWLTAFASEGCQSNAIRTIGSRIPSGLWRQSSRSISATACVSSIRSNFYWRSRKQYELNKNQPQAYKRPEAADVDDEFIEFNNDFREAINDVDFNTVIKLFPEARERQVLTGTLLWRTVQCVHEGLRRVKRNREDDGRRETIEDLIAFAEQLANAVRKGDLEPDRRAHLHLLAIFKEGGAQAQGIAFWEWLEEQDERYVGLDVYGGAIELLSVYGTPLRELEQMYGRALQRFPASFNAYHLSPEAVVPDRDQAIEIKGISMMLLQGILTARLLRGESQKAYLALDTALRLYPTLTPSRIFAMFIEERPLNEAYTVFALACRAGVVLPFDTARKLLTALRSSADMSSPDSHITALRQMLSVVYMYLGAGGSLTSNVVNEIIIAFTQTLRLDGVAGLDGMQKKVLVSTTLDAIRKTLEIFARYGTKPGLSAFNSIIVNLGGHGQSRKIITVALRDAQALSLRPNHVTRRSIVVAAGMLGDKDYVAQAWQDLVYNLELQSKKAELPDYNILMKAAKASGAVDFAEQVLEPAMKYIPQEVTQSMRDRLHNPVEEDQSSKNALDVSSLLEQMKQLSADLAVVDDRTVDRPIAQNFAEQHLPMTIPLLPLQHSGSEQEQKALYDELTTEQPAVNTPEPAGLAMDALSTPEDSSTDSEAKSDIARLGTSANTDSENDSPDPLPPPAPPASSTGLTFGSLRYENWKTINYLLALADHNDNAYNAAVDQAINAGIAPPKREAVLRGTALPEEPYFGLSDMATLDGEREDKGYDAQLRKPRQEILRLRGRTATK